MSEYRLVVTRIDPNPVYDPKMIERQGSYGWNPEAAAQHVEAQILYVMLTEDEFRQCKASILRCTVPVVLDNA